MPHIFKGSWITTDEFYRLAPRNVFHKQLQKVDLPCNEHRNRHILFRKKFMLESAVQNAVMYISADDYYKLYINGNLVTLGPTPAYHFKYNYNTVDVTKYLTAGENTVAVHTLYQGLINRVWQSGDTRHGLILDLVCDGKTVIQSDETFKTAYHSAYTETGIFGYDTQFAEHYNSCADEVGFFAPQFDDSAWLSAKKSLVADHTLVPQTSAQVVLEKITPTVVKTDKKRVFIDFGKTYVGYLCATVISNGGEATVRCSQELCEDGTLRYALRANCEYSEGWTLKSGRSTLDWFDYKSFRYAELILPENAHLEEVYLLSRHYPFNLSAGLNPELFDRADSEIVSNLKKVWELCINTQKYGVGEVIQDCMEREKGFYVGDGCYTALTNMVLTGDDKMVRKLIDDAFSSSFISDTLVTCLNCSFMQEIAEFPLILIFLVLWHYNYTSDRKYLRSNFAHAKSLLESYRKHYESGGLLRNLDKWCVVEWPYNFRHGYDVEIAENKICTDAHVAINAYYVCAVRAVNKMAKILGVMPYRDPAPLINAFYDTFYIKDKHIFKDGENTSHTSLVGNAFVYSFSLCEDEKFKEQFLADLRKNEISSLSLFCTFPILMRLTLDGRYDLVAECLTCKDAWLRTVREGGTTTFEGWGKDTKWNTSLFHLTMSYGALFLCDADIKSILDIF